MHSEVIEFYKQKCVEDDISIHCKNCDYPRYPFETIECIKRKILPSFLCNNCDYLLINSKVNNEYYSYLEIFSQMYQVTHEFRMIKHLTDNLKFTW